MLALCSYQTPLSFLLPRIWQRVLWSETKSVSFEEHKAKLQLRFSWISKNISSQMRTETLPKQSSKFFGRPARSRAADITVYQKSVWRLASVCACCLRTPWSMADRFAANPPGAQLLCRGATVCKLAAGKQRGRDVQAVILSKYLWHQQPLYNDYSYLIPQFDCVIKNLFITWLPGFWGQHNKSLGIARASVFVSDLQGSATKH